jgi:hypothetical protein
VQRINLRYQTALIGLQLCLTHHSNDVSFVGAPRTNECPSDSSSYSRSKYEAIRSFLEFFEQRLFLCSLSFVKSDVSSSILDGNCAQCFSSIAVAKYHYDVTRSSTDVSSWPVTRH